MPHGKFNQSGTKPNLVAKILAAKFGVFLWYIECFEKYVQYESYNYVINYYGPLSFEKFGRLPT